MENDYNGNRVSESIPLVKGGQGKSDEEVLGAAYGAFWGCLISLVLWGFIALVGVLVF